MTNLIKIKNIPKNIKLKLIKHFYQDLYLVGYKKIKSNKKLPIIELFNYTRIWILPEEITIKL
uniref:Cytochrome b6-f complex subunit PetP n=1 Tax=Dipterocladia arabiensis TaxID=2007176 RepID=A0A1Z1M0K2_9FLOR|nr:cytochrome b6-f complex subunit PetP [Dipterocladia arabiensis]ARW59412.1 cytochrome b6-f complex subunit PetP [Dipterocladia arabiensis]